MAQVLKNALIGYPSSMAIFQRPRQDIGTKKTRSVIFLPMNDISDQKTLMFSIPGNTQSYLDLSKTTLNIRCKIVKKDGTPIDSWEEELRRREIKHRLIAAGFEAGDDALPDPGQGRAPGPSGTGGPTTEGPPEKKTTGRGSSASGDQPAEARGERKTDGDQPRGAVGVVCNLLHSMIQRVDVSLNNTVVTESDTSYPYQSYIKTHFYSPREVKESALQMQMYFPDSDGTASESNWTGIVNSGLYLRSLPFDGSKEVELMGKLCCDVFDINKLIVNGTALQVVIYPSNDEFCLMSTDDAPDYKLVITAAYLSVYYVDVSSEIIAAHSEILKDEPAIYPYLRSEVKKVAMPQGIFQHTISDIFQGRIPQEILIGLVPGNAVFGDFRANPYSFENGHLRRIQVTMDGQDLINSPIECNYREGLVKGLYLDGFRSLNGMSGIDNENPISRYDYPQGNAVYRFVSESSERDLGEDLIPLRRMGNLRISLSFDKMLEKSFTVIIYGRFGAALKIDKNRTVIQV